MNILHALGLAAVLMLAGCDRLPGRPGAREEVVRPEEVLDFKSLYSENCSGCHGAEGKGGASIALRNPVLLAIADDAVIRKIAAEESLGLRWLRLRRAKEGCSPTSRSTYWSTAFGLGGRMFRVRVCRLLRRSYPETRSAEPPCTRGFALPATAQRVKGPKAGVRSRMRRTWLW